MDSYQDAIVKALAKAESDLKLNERLIKRAGALLGRGTLVIDQKYHTIEVLKYLESRNEQLTRDVDRLRKLIYTDPQL